MENTYYLGAKDRLFKRVPSKFNEVLRSVIGVLLVVAVLIFIASQFATYSLTSRQDSNLRKFGSIEGFQAQIHE